TLRGWRGDALVRGGGTVSPPNYPTTAWPGRAEARRLMTVPEVATALACSVNTVRKLTEQKLLHAVAYTRWAVALYDAATIEGIRAANGPFRREWTK
ncbi:MAG: hypothetical protein ACT4PO_15440, partial [Actinomycetota bacterium]